MKENQPHTKKKRKKSSDQSIESTIESVLGAVAALLKFLSNVNHYQLSTESPKNKHDRECLLDEFKPMFGIAGNGLTFKKITEYLKYVSTISESISPSDIIGDNQYYACSIDWLFKIMEKLQILVCNKLTSFLYGKNGSLVFLKGVLQCVGYINSQDAILLKYKSIYKVTELPNSTRHRQFQNTTFIFEYLVNEVHDELLRRYATNRTCMMVPDEILDVLVVSNGLYCTNSAPLFSNRGQIGFNVFIVDKSDNNGDIYRRLYMQSPAERQYVLVTTEVFDAALQSAGLRLNAGEPVVMHERVRVEDPNNGQLTEELAYIIYHPDDCRLFIFIPTHSGSNLDLKERIRRHGPDVNLYWDWQTP